MLTDIPAPHRRQTLQKYLLQEQVGGFVNGWGWVSALGLHPAPSTQPGSNLLLLGPEVTDLLLVLLVEPLHVLPRLLQQVTLPQQLPVLPPQHVHVILQLRLVAQQPAVEGAETPTHTVRPSRLLPQPQDITGTFRAQDSQCTSQEQPQPGDSTQGPAKPAVSPMLARPKALLNS